MKKRFIYFFAAWVFSLTAEAQGRLDSIKMGEANGAKYTTGTGQDILANYLQVAVKNITGNDNSFKLKLNWFALNSMDSVDKYNNNNFAHTGWQRNGELIGSVGLDKNGKVNSWTAGLNYNILNRRDIATHYFISAYMDAFTEEGLIINKATETYFPQVSLFLVPKFIAVCTILQDGGVPVTDLKDKLNAAIPGMLQEVKMDNDVVKLLQDQLNTDIAKRLRTGELSPEMLALISEVANLEARKTINNPINDYIKTSGKKELIFSDIITPALKKSIVDFLDAQVRSNAVLNGRLKAKTLIEANDKVIADYSQLLKYVGRQPLLTLGYLYTHGTGTALSSHVGGLNFLKGFGKLRSDKIGQLKASLTDTLSGNDPTGKTRNFKRNIIAFQVGYNQVLAVQKKLSVMELNIAVENDWATNGYINGTDRKRIYFDAYFRARLPSTPWLKLDLKYDPKDGNLFGLLNLTYNFDK